MRTVRQDRLDIETRVERINDHDQQVTHRKVVNGDECTKDESSPEDSRD